MAHIQITALSRSWGELAHQGERSIAQARAAAIIIARELHGVLVEVGETLLVELEVFDPVRVSAVCRRYNLVWAIVKVD